MARNIDEDTVDHFGREWSLFDQRAMSGEELTRTFNEYFSIFPWSILSEDAIGFDLGCGSGRWARFVAPRVGRLHCVDASKEALAVAKKNLADFDNCDFAVASVDEMPMEEESMDFGYSIGVLHLVPDAAGALKHCSRKLKPGAPFLAYIHYAFDNRPLWYRLLWKMSDVIRVAISRLPFRLKVWLSGLIAVLVYWPVARLWALLESLGAKVGSLPLSA